MIEHQPRITPLPLMDPDDQLEYIQRTTLMRYPDIITVQFVKISDNKSALAIYSRSIYGRKDFGANEKRIQQWLDMLN